MGEGHGPARDGVRRTLTQLRTYLSQENPRRLSEADTKAHFIDPIITALGWVGIGSVTREYYVRNSQEFIDYVMFGPRPPQNQRGPLLAVEAKALQSDLTEKHAAQLVQYCSVEGIEWAALANGRELQFFNTFLKPDLEAKRVLKIDLLAFNTDDEFDLLFDQLWRLSRESLTEPSGVRTWLNQLRLDAELRQIMLDPASQTIRQLRRHLNQVDVSASANDIVSWFRNHLAPPLLAIPSTNDAKMPTPVEVATDQLRMSDRSHYSQDGPDIPGWENVYGLDRWPNVRDIFVALYAAVDQRWEDVNWRATKYYIAASVGSETFLVARTRMLNLPVGLALPKGVSHPRLNGDASVFSWNRITSALDVHSVQEVENEFLSLVGRAHQFAQPSSDTRKPVQRVTLIDIDAGLVEPGAQLVLKAGNREVAEATVTSDGQIDLDGIIHGTPSDAAFARLLGPTRTSLNGWMHWHVRLPEGDILFDEFRQRFRNGSTSSETLSA